MLRYTLKYVKVYLHVFCPIYKYYEFQLLMFYESKIILPPYVEFLLWYMYN